MARNELQISLLIMMKIRTTEEICSRDFEFFK